MDSIFPQAILSVASLVNNAVSSARSAKELAKQSSDSELKAAVSDLYDSIIEVKDRVLDLDQENRSLREALAKRSAIHRAGPFGYYFKEGSTDPLCPNCIETKATQVHLTNLERVAGGTLRKCRGCKEEFWEEEKQKMGVIRIGRPTISDITRGYQ